MATVIEITDFSDPRLDVFARLTEAQLRRRPEGTEGLFVAESPKVIGRALDGGCVPVSFLTTRKHIAGQARELLERCPDIPVFTADDGLLEDLTGYALTRGVLCAMERPVLPPAEEVCGNARRVAVLEGIVDPTNVGAIFRSAAAMHMDGVLLTPTCCDPLHRRAARVSMGTVFQIPWARLGDHHSQWPEEGLGRLRAMGFQTAAMALTDRSVSIEEEALARADRLAIILGTEGDGLGQATVDGCDFTVKIPMSHGVDSLNVAAAGAVAFWQLRAR